MVATDSPCNLKLKIHLKALKFVRDNYIKHALNVGASASRDFVLCSHDPSILDSLDTISGAAVLC